MTEQWRRAIRHLNLWKKFTRNSTDANYEAFKTQQITGTSLRRKAIKQHFAKRTADTKNPREFWSTFRPFLHTKSKQANYIILKENDRIISDKREIANLLNDYFVHIADSMPEIRVEDYSEDYANHPRIKAIHEHRGASAPACFSFHRASETQVELLLKEINVRKSPSHDMIPPKLIKEAAAIIARPITSIINWPWLDSAVHRINHYPEDSVIDFLILILWIVIYPVGTAIQRLNNRGLLY